MNPRKFQSLSLLKWTFLMIFFSATAHLYSCGSLQATTTSGDLNADISVKNRPLKEVVNLIQEQTGYKVELKSVDESFLVTGKYDNVAADKILTHLLKGHNISVVINPTDKLISLISLGDKTQRNKDTQDIESMQLAPQDNIEPESNSSVPSGADSATVTEFASEQSPEPADISDQNIQELQAQQARDLDRQQANPNDVDPLTGMTHRALEDMHNKQIVESNKIIKN